MKRFFARLKHSKIWRKIEQFSLGKKKRWRYKRHVLQRNKWPELIKKLELNLANPYFFNSLQDIGKTKGHVKLFYFGEIPVVIKDTQRRDMHGFNYKEIRRSLLVHQKAALKGKISPERYRLITPKVYGRIGRYLVMEYMEHRETPKAGKTENQAEITSFSRAYKELEENFTKAIRISKTFGVDIPQVFHLMVLGNTNPKNPDKGVWLFSLPYDLY